MHVRPTFCLVCLVLLAASTFSGCRSPYYADRGAAVGGLAGAATGAAIGSRSGKTAPGALIGGAVGALSGAAIGSVMDEEIAHSQAVIEQRMGRRLEGAVRMHDVVAMTHAGISEDVIITHIRANGMAARPGVDDIIALHQQGVSQTVIKAMQYAEPPHAPPARVVRPAPPPVIVEEHYWGPSWGPYYYHPRYRHRYTRAPRSGVSWGITFGN